jgi:hypothetical protein
MSNSPKKNNFLKGLASLDTTAASTAYENLLLTPINEVRQAFTTTGVAISHHTGEFLLRSSPLKASPTKWMTNHHPAKEEQDDEKKQEEEFFIEEQPTSSCSRAVDICPRFDGTGIELVVDDRADRDAIKEDDTVIKLKSPHIRGSLLMFDPIAAAAEDDEIISMNIKVLQGKNLPFDNTKIRIGILNSEGGAVDQIVGCTPSSEGSPDPRNPIWGSRINSWSFSGNRSTKFLFTLLVDEANTDQGDKNKEKPRICAKVSAADLLMKRNPNFWIKLKDHSDASSCITECGRIQIRLNKPTEATLHEQENCFRITPGPSMPRMQSYAVRKMAMYSCSPVTLNVYDVSNNRKIETINNTMKSIGYGGIFHAAIEIHGKEYSFGGTMNKKSNVSGVFPCQPKQCPMHHYRESVFLGDCELNTEQVLSILKVLRPKWMARSYNVFRKNCAFFSREFAIELGVGDLPEWVYTLATTAESIEPYLKSLDTYLKNRTKTAYDTSTKPQKATTTKTKTTKQNTADQVLTKKADAKMKVDVETDDHMEAHCVAKNTQEALFDHAMAAKIQRSFRNVKSKRASMHRAETLRKIHLQEV